MQNMKQFKIYEDPGNVKPIKRPRCEGSKRRVLGEIKNTIITRSKSSTDINVRIENIKLNKKKPIETTNCSKKPILKKTLKVQSEKILDEEKNSSPNKVNKRLSSVFNCYDYADDIYKYLMFLEQKYEIKPNPCLKEQFKEGTRLALLDWFVEMHEFVEMSTDTFQLAVSIFDRYLQEDDSIKKTELQLVALVSAFLSSKYEEVYPTMINDLVFVSDNAFTIQDIYDMEMRILLALEYNFGRPVAANFITRYTIVTKANRIEQSLALYFSDVALLSYDMCYLRPSLIACTAFYIALCTYREEIDPKLWDKTLIEHSKYRFHEFEGFVSILADLVVRSSVSKYEALKRKYSKSLYQSVSLMPCLTPGTGIINRLINKLPST